MRNALDRRGISRLLAAVVTLVQPLVGSASVESGFGVAAGGNAASGEESFKTDFFSGAATNSIPAVLPAGSNGFQPQVALTYSSQRGNGWAGRGWDLSLPSISRMTKFGTPSYSDSPVSGDRFSLNDDRLVRDDAGTYRTMRDSFARIERVETAPGSGIVSHWILGTTDGITQWFGSTPDSQITNPTNSKVFRWLLSRAQDANGNYIRYEYYTPAETGSAYPKRISYSFEGDETTGSAIRSLDFGLSVSARPDTTIVYTGGFRTEQSKRLETITVWTGPNTDPSNRVASYDLLYTDEDGAVSDPPNAASLLRKVIRKGVNDSSELPADVFTYSGSSLPSWTANGTIASRLASLRVGVTGPVENFNLANGNWRFLELNGDGVPDLVATKFQWTLVQVNLWEAVYLNSRDAFQFPSSMLGAAGVFQPPSHVADVVDHELMLHEPQVTGPFPPVWSVFSAPLWADYTGDGRVDLLDGMRVIDFPDGTSNKSFENNGKDWVLNSGAYPTPPVHPVVARDFDTNDTQCLDTSNWVRGRSILADVNGDGLADLLYHAASDTATCSQVASQSNWTDRRVYLNTGTGWQTTPHPAWSAQLGAVLDGLSAWLDDLVFFDVNGDGLVDVAEDSDSDGTIDGNAVRVNNGTGWVTDTGLSVVTGFRPVDLNGDGLLDHATWGFGARLGTGSDFSSTQFNVPNLGTGRAMVDLDGDGLVDLLRGDGSTAEAQMASASAPPDLVVGITRGTGGTATVSYTPSTAGNCVDSALGGCHAIDSGSEDFQGGVTGFTFSASAIDCTAPLVYLGSNVCLLWKERLPIVVQTVQSTTIDDATGTGNSRTDLAHYDLGNYDLLEREFRGFGFVSERPQALTYTNPKGTGTTDLGLLRITEFYQLAFLRGAAARTTLFASPDGDPYTPGEVGIEQTWTQYALTRGDLSATLLLQANVLANLCDPNVGDVVNPAGRPDCPFVNLQVDPYLTQIPLPAPHPYAPFQGEFCGPTNPTNRDCPFAYLVLPVGAVTRVLDDDGTTPVDFHTIRWFDTHGNVQAEFAKGDTADPTDDRTSVTTFAAPGTGAPANFFARPSFVVQQTPTGTVLTSTQIDYDSLPNGQVSLGNVTATRSDLVDPVNGLDTTVTVTRCYADSVLVCNPPSAGGAGLPRHVSDSFVAGATPRFTSYGYDSRKAFVTSTTRGGLVTQTFYDPSGAPPGLGVLQRTEDENDVSVTYTADTFGRPTSRTGPIPVGTVESRSYNDFTGYNPAQARITITRSDGNPANNVTTRTFTDGLGREIRTEQDGLNESDAAATIAQATTYDKLGRVSFQSRPGFGSPSGNGTSIFYDLRGRVRFVKQPDNGVQEVAYEGLSATAFDAANRRTDSLRDGAGSLVRVTEYPDATPRATNYLHDFLGRLRRVCFSPATSCTLTESGGLQTTSDPRHSILIDYDSLGRRVRIADPDLGDWRYSYDGSGNVLTRRDALNRTVSYTYDVAFGRRKTEDWDGAGGAEVTLTYGDELVPPPANSKGRVVTSAEPNVLTSYVYDGAGRATSTTTQFLPAGGTHTVQSAYDWWDRPTSTSYPDGEVVTRVYDQMGVDRVHFGTTRTYVADVKHNAEGRLRRLDYGNGGIREFTYQATTTGYLESLTGRHGAGANFLSRGYTYDLTARIQSITDGVESTESLSAITYDGAGRLKTATRGGTGSLSYDYDDLGNLTSKEGVTQPFTHPTKPHALYDATQPMRFVYDANGNLTRRGNTTLGYDSLNRLVSLTGRLPSSYVYDRGGERVRKQHGADVSRFLGPDYEIQNGVRFVKTIRVEGVIVAQVSMPTLGGGASTLPGGPGAIDPAVLAGVLAGLLVLAASSGLVARHGSGPAWERALVAGLCMALATAPGLPALAAAPGDVKEDGRLDPADPLLLQRELTDPLFSLTPEEEQAADVAPFVNGEPQSNDVLDAADLLVLLRGLSSEDVDGDNLVGADDPVPLSRSNFDADQDGLDDDAEGAAGTLKNNFDTDGDGIVDGKDGDPLNPAGTQILYVHADHLGGSAVITDTGGTVVRRVRYGIFGEVRSNDRIGPPSTLDPAEKYTGQRFDAETGLAYYGARYYDPATGRFVSPDSVVPDLQDPQSLNRYSYVHNDPLGRIDPLGNFDFDFSFSVYGGFIDPYGGFTGGSLGVSGGSRNSASVAAFDASAYLGGVQVAGFSVAGVSSFAGTAYKGSTQLFSYRSQVSSGVTSQPFSFAETAWDAFNIGLGIYSAQGNLREGNYGAAALDTLGVGVDAAAAILPLIPGGAGTLIRGLRGAGAIGRAGEEAVSRLIGISRNVGARRATVPGTGSGGFRVPDFDPALTIASRGTVVEVKNVQGTLSISPQLRDLAAFANSRGVPLEIFTNAAEPSRGDLFNLIQSGRVILTPIP